MAKPKPFRLEDRVDIARTAERFEVTTGDVKAAISQVMEERGEVTLSVSRRNQEMTQYIRQVYDEQAKAFSFKDMVHMLAVFHTELLSRGIVDPNRFAKEAAKVSADVMKFVYPKETATVTRKLPPGESRDVILARVLSRLKEQDLLPPGRTETLHPSNTPSPDDTTHISLESLHREQLDESPLPTSEQDSQLESESVDISALDDPRA